MLFRLNSIFVCFRLRLVHWTFRNILELFFFFSFGIQYLDDSIICYSPIAVVRQLKIAVRETGNQNLLSFSQRKPKSIMYTHLTIPFTASTSSFFPNFRWLESNEMFVDDKFEQF